MPGVVVTITPVTGAGTSVVVVSVAPSSDDSPIVVPDSPVPEVPVLESSRSGTGAPSVPTAVGVVPTESPLSPVPLWPVADSSVVATGAGRVPVLVGVSPTVAPLSPEPPWPVAVASVDEPSVWARAPRGRATDISKAITVVRVIETLLGIGGRSDAW